MATATKWGAIQLAAKIMACQAIDHCMDKEDVRGLPTLHSIFMMAVGEVLFNPLGEEVIPMAEKKMKPKEAKPKSKILKKVKIKGDVNDAGSGKKKPKKAG